MKLNPKVFTRAAELIADGQECHACTALIISVDERHTPDSLVYLYMDLLVTWFRPNGASLDAPWWCGHYRYQDAVEARVMALLICSYICKEEE